MNADGCARLLTAVLRQAVWDARSGGARAMPAAIWLYSDDAAFYAGLLGLVWPPRNLAALIGPGA